MAEYYYTDDARQPAGPLPLERLRAMFDRGELAPDALVAEVGADRWETAADVFGSNPPAAGRQSPPITPGPITGGSQGFEPLAGWSFGLGMASWLCFGSLLPAIPGVILGHMALSRMSQSGNTDSASKVLAIIGLITSYLSLALGVLGIVLGMGFGVLSWFVP